MVQGLGTSGLYEKLSNFMFTTMHKLGRPWTRIWKAASYRNADNRYLATWNLWSTKNLSWSPSQMVLPKVDLLLQTLTGAIRTYDVFLCIITGRSKRNTYCIFCNCRSHPKWVYHTGHNDCAVLDWATLLLDHFKEGAKGSILSKQTCFTMHTIYHESSADIWTKTNLTGHARKRRRSLDKCEE